MIKLIRLKNGTDITCFFEANKKTSILTQPVVSYIKYNTKNYSQELIMSFWLPRNLVEENSAEIKNDEILLVMEPKEEFKEYYLNFLNNFKSLEELTEEEFDLDLLEEMIEEFEEEKPKSKKLH